MIPFQLQSFYFYTENKIPNLRYFSTMDRLRIYSIPDIFSSVFVVVQLLPKQADPLMNQRVSADVGL